MAEDPGSTPQIHRDPREVVREIVRRTGGDIRVATPLGLGKPVTLLNALTELALEDSSIHLSIFTALTLERPHASGDLEKRFLGPSMDRLFGAYPEITYAKLLRAGELPNNIEVTEFFFLAGRWKGHEQAQRKHISVNFSDALEVLLAKQPNVTLQLLARDGDRLSLSCNTDVTVDLLRLRREGRISFLMVGETNPQLPFMDGPASIPLGEADLLLDDPDSAFELFSVVKQPVKERDHAIGLHVSRLIRDGGSLQIGIGRIGDAAAHALLLRQHGEIGKIWADFPFPFGGFHEDGPFVEGLYGVTEMLVDAMLPLFEHGVIGREVNGKVIHAGFFVGCRDFYKRLREMPADKRAKIEMMPISFTNTLYGDEAGKRAARRDARFVNQAMMVTLLGAVVSDGTGDGQIVSGVGGQFDFVTQAFALQGARSIIAVPATRLTGGKTENNIVWSYPHATVPRHKRDIVVTEYGIADLRGRSDEDVIAAMLSVADSRFQDELLTQAQDAGKISRDFTLEDKYRQNLPETVSRWLQPHDLPVFPLGTDFDPIEKRLLPALSKLRQARASKMELARLAWVGKGPLQTDEEAQCLARMGFETPDSLTERTTAAALLGALRET